MGDIDAGTVKAKVVIEADTSGAEKVKQALKDIEEAAGSAGESAGNAGDGLAKLEERAGGASEGVAQLAENAAGLEKPMQAAQTVVTELTDAVGEHQAAIEQAGESYKALQEPLGTTVSMLEDAGPPMLAIGQHAQVAAEQLGPVGDNLAQIGDALGQSTPLLAPFAESVRVVDSTLAGSSQGFSDFHENMAVFQDALNNPAPFAVVQSHIAETGQSWSDFAASIGEDNMHVLDNMSKVAIGLGGGGGLGPIALTPDRLANIGPETVWDQTASSIMGASTAASDAVSPFAALNETFVSTRKNAETIGPPAELLDKNITSFGNAAADASPQLGAWNQVMGDTGLVMEDTNKAVENATPQFGAWNEVMGDTGLVMEDLGKAATGGGLGGGLGGFLSDAAGGVGGFFGGIMNSMNAIAMPLMAVQMIGMAVSTVGQGIYDAAAVAEGPAAHSVGTFTGAVDALGASSAKAGQQFSESFGRQIMPTIDAINNVTASNQGGPDFWGGWLGGIGTIATIATTGLIGGGLNLLGSGLTLGQQNNWGGGIWDIASQSAQNEWASINGQPLPFQGPPPPDLVTAGLQQQTAALQTQIASPAYPGYLAAQAQAASLQQNAAIAQTAYNDSHYVGAATPADSNYIANEAMNALYGPGTATLPTSGGDLAANAAWFNSLGDPYVGPHGCFPAGTRVRMANGSERAIETLQPGDQVIAHDGIQQRPTVVLARIVPPPKQTYQLTFADRNTLTLTDSHPIASVQGWKSLSPAATKQENPDLDVSELHIGDHIYTADDVTCTLVAIEQRDVVQVFNVTVDAPHTFYANDILVHNKVQSMTAGGQDVGVQIADQVSGIQLPHIDLSGISSSLSGAFSGIQLPHIDLSGIGSNLSGAFSGIQLPHLDLSGIGASLGGAFSGISLPHIDLSGIGADLSGAFSGISLPHIDLSGIGASLSGAFSGIQLPSIPDIGSQISSQLSNMFGGISMPSVPQLGAMITGAMGGLFSGISLPAPPDVGAMITGLTSGLFGGITLPSAPELGAMITGLMSSMFSGITLPSVPNLGAMITGLMSGMFSGIILPQVPFFADGVTNFAGGPAVVGEAGTEAVTYNGQTALFDQGAAFVNLPAGSSVYPMQDMANYAFSGLQRQSISGGGISLGGSSGGGGPQSVNVVVQIDGQSIVSAIGMPLAQTIRVGAGMRGY